MNLVIRQVENLLICPPMELAELIRWPLLEVSALLKDNLLYVKRNNLLEKIYSKIAELELPDEMVEACFEAVR